MANDTVTVQALELHTYHGQTYAVGATYAVDAGDLDTLVAQGKARRVDAAKADRHAYHTTETAPTHTAVLTPKSKRKK